MTHDALFMDEMPTPPGHTLIAETLALLPGETARLMTTPSPEPLSTWDDPFARGEGPPPVHRPRPR